MSFREGITAWARRGFATLFAAVATLLLAPLSAGADEVDWMYHSDALVEINLGELSPEELDKLELEPTKEVPGTFELKVDGVTKAAFDEVGIRLKGGAGSSRPVKTGKAAFKIRFDKFVDDQLFFGIKRLTLNNMIQDESMLHETLTYELFHALGLPASRSGYANVTLNGINYGLYLNLETLDEISLPFPFDNGHLYEADAPGTDLTPGDEFEVDEGDDGDISDLEALVAAVNDGEGDWSENVDPFADLEQITAQWAVERYVAHWDGYAGLPNSVDPNTRPNNYYLLSDEDGVFRFMPWGTDQTWEREDVEFDEVSGAVMFNECLTDATCFDLYLAGLTDVHCAVQELGQGAHATKLAAMLEPYQEDEDEVRRESTLEEIAEEVEEVETFAAVRPEQLEEFLIEEGVLGGAVDPCAEPELEEPQKPQQPQQPIGDPAPRAATATFGPSRLAGAFVVTRVQIDGAGSATQRVTARIEGERVTVCTDRASRAAAGRLTLRCKLTRKAQQARDAGPLKLRVKVRFVPALGTPSAAIRSLTAPARD